MIAKRIDTKAATSRVARLVKYVVAAQGGNDPRSWTRTADYMLNSGTSNRGEKVGGVRVTNCHTDDPAAATALIECTQAANTRSKTDKTYHLVFSFPPGEEPDIKILNVIEDELVKSIGYADHQRISAVHIDCDHLHVHVAINKVHPIGYQNIEPYFDKKKLMETCERLELEYGLTRTNHGLHGEKPKAKIRDKQATAEAHSGIESLTGYVSREVAPAIHKATNWQQLHAALAEHGLSIKKRGAGLVIGTGETWVRASQCDRSFSLKGLTDRLGEYEKNVHPASTAYTPKPRQTHISSAALFDQYQQQQRKHKTVREYGIERLKYDGAILELNLQKWRKAQRALVKVAAKGPTRRAMLKVVRLQTTATRNANRRAMDAQRKQIMSETAMPSWAVWLSQQAEQGNTEALDVLRSRGAHTPMHGDSLTAENAATVILKRYQLQAGTNGVLTYNVSDGGLVIDRKTFIQSHRTTERSTLLALELAAKRFNGQSLIMEGQATFQNDVARLAGIHGYNVRFADPALEQVRKESKPKGKTITNEVEL